MAVVLQNVTRDNWRETLQLGVHPSQQRFVADYAPIAAIALAKAFVRPTGLVWVPYAIYADALLVGLLNSPTHRKAAINTGSTTSSSTKHIKAKGMARQPYMRLCNWLWKNILKCNIFNSQCILKITVPNSYTRA